MAIRLPSGKDGGADTTIQGSAAALSTVEDIGLSGRCARSLGHGKNTVYQALSESYRAGRDPRSDGKEVPVNLVYEQVEVAAKYSQ